MTDNGKSHLTSIAFVRIDDAIGVFFVKGTSFFKDVFDGFFLCARHPAGGKVGEPFFDLGNFGAHIDDFSDRRKIAHSALGIYGAASGGDDG